MTDHSTRCLKKATQHNLPKTAIFQKKNGLPRVGFEPTCNVADQTFIMTAYVGQEVRAESVDDGDGFILRYSTHNSYNVCVRNNK